MLSKHEEEIITKLFVSRPTDIVICIFNFQTQNLHSNVATFPYKCTLVPPVALHTISSNELNSAGATFWLSLPKKQNLKTGSFPVEISDLSKIYPESHPIFTLSPGLLSHPNRSFSGICKVKEFFLNLGMKC